MPSTPPHNFRINGIRKRHLYYEWLQKTLKDEYPLDYFSFANEFKENEQITNSRYSNLLNKLTNPKQSKKILELAGNAKKTFQTRKKNKKIPGFAQDYDTYWNSRKDDETLNTVKGRQNKTVVNLNGLTCRGIENRAHKIYNAEFVSQDVQNRDGLGPAIKLFKAKTKTATTKEEPVLIEPDSDEELKSSPTDTQKRARSNFLETGIANIEVNLHKPASPSKVNWHRYDIISLTSNDSDSDEEDVFITAPSIPIEDN